MPLKSRDGENFTNMENRLRPHQNEFQQLNELSGIHMNSKVFRILVELLNMGVDPSTISKLLSTIQKSTERQKSSRHSTK